MRVSLQHRQVLAALRRTVVPSSAETEAACSRVRRVIGAMLLSNGLSILLQLGIVPVLIWAWGATVYGEWIILYTIPGYLALSDFGVIATANNRIDAQCACGRFGAANRTYFNSLLVLSGLIGLITGAAILLWSFFGAGFIKMFETLTPDEVLEASALLFADAMLTLLLNHHSALYRTLARFNWTVNWQAALRVVPIVVLCIAAAVGARLPVAISVMLAVRLVLGVLLGLDLRRRVTWLRRDWLRANRMEARRLLRGAVGFMMLPLSNMLYLHVTTLIVAAVSSPVGVAAFSTLRTLTRMIPQLVSISGRACWSEVAKSAARGEHFSVELMRRRVLRQTIGLCVLVVLGYLFLGPSFYHNWTTGALPFDWPLFLALLANGVMIAMYTSLEVFVLAVNRVAGYAQLFLAVTVVQIVVGWVLVGTTGIIIFPILGTLGAGTLVGYLLVVQKVHGEADRQRSAV